MRIECIDKQIEEEAKKPRLSDKAFAEVMLGRKNKIEKLYLWTCSLCGFDTSCGTSQCRECGANWPSYVEELIKEMKAADRKIKARLVDVEMTDATVDLKKKKKKGNRQLDHRDPGEQPREKWKPCVGDMPCAR